MDFLDATKVVYTRIQKLEPEFVFKIIGFLLLQEHAEHDMIRLAFGPETLIHSAINTAKAQLGLSLRPAVSVSEPSMQYVPFPSQFLWESPTEKNQHNVQAQSFLPSSQINSIREGGHSHSQYQYTGLDDHLDNINGLGTSFSHNYFSPEQLLAGNLNVRTNRRAPIIPEFPVRSCQYYSKGQCKHGANCRFFHGEIVPDSFSQTVNASHGDLGFDEQVLSPGALERLEFELIELLKSRRGVPVSIAALPMLYLDKYGKHLQADGYLTESQRQGKAGYNLTRLLVRLKNSIRLIDRPHGQHSVVLVEDVPRFMDYKNERNDGAKASVSRQIYLTFPAESTFSADDVEQYFNTYGPVQDVRIPSQQKRMFGFVTFLYPETVKNILNKGNPHFVCGARVLVKPYREKSTLDRKYDDKIDLSMQCTPRLFDLDYSQLYAGQCFYDNPRLLRKQLFENHELALEHERMRLAEFQLASKSLTPLPYASYPTTEDAKIADQSPSLSDDHIDFILDVINNGESNDDKARSAEINEQESQEPNLPDSPFASPIKKQHSNSDAETAVVD